MSQLVGKMEVKKHAIRQTQDGWVVSFVVHPSDMTPEFAAAPLGTRLMIGYAEYTDEAPAEAPARNPDRSERAREQYAMKDKMAQARDRAVMLCKDTKFRAWAWSMDHHSSYVTGHYDEGGAARWMQTRLNISSRSQIASDERAYQAFLALEASYKQSVGQLAEQRG